MWHRSEIQDGILRVTINRQDRPVNALSKSALEELRSLLQTIKADSGIRGVIFSSGKPGTFIAGADITEFENLTSEAEARQVSEFGQSVFQELEDLSVPTVAVISGACLGGGLEFALACTYRIADDHEKTRIGLPEVQLGLLPGWGGTVRLPRLIGLIDALPWILSGQQLSGYQARSRGIVQDVVPTEALPDVAEKILKTHIEHGSAKRLFRLEEARLATLAGTHAMDSKHGAAQSAADDAGENSRSVSRTAGHSEAAARGTDSQHSREIHSGILRHRQAGGRTGHARVPPSVLSPGKRPQASGRPDHDVRPERTAADGGDRSRGDGRGNRPAVGSKRRVHAVEGHQTGVRGARHDDRARTAPEGR